MPRGVGLNWLFDEAQLQRRLLTPSVLGDAVRMWITPRDITTVSLDGAGRVSQVRDLSPYRVNFEQPGSASRPTYVAGGSLTGIANQGTGQNFMVRDTGAAVTVSDYTLFMCVMWTDNSSGLYPAFITAAATGTSDDFATGFSIDRGLNGGTANPFSTIGATSPKDNTNTNLLAQSIAYNVPTILCVRVRDATESQSIRINGREQGLSRIPTNPTATIGLRLMRLFVRYYNQSFQGFERGIISEMFLVGRTMSSAEIQWGEAYIARSSGVQHILNPSHPFAIRPPLIGD